MSSKRLLTSTSVRDTIGDEVTLRMMMISILRLRGIGHLLYKYSPNLPVTNLYSKVDQNCLGLYDLHEKHSQTVTWGPHIKIVDLHMTKSMNNIVSTSEILQKFRTTFWIDRPVDNLSKQKGSTPYQS